jgi:pilus assembly protein CpaC
MRAPMSYQRRLYIRTALALSMVATQRYCFSQSTSAAASNPAPFATVSIGGTSAGVSRLASSEKTLHLVVGHSVFLNTQFRLRRVYVTDPALLMPLTLAPSQAVVTAMAPGISSLILQDEIGQTQSYVVSSDVDVEGLRTAISGAMKDDTVRVEANGTHVTLEGTVPSQAIADTAVKLASLYTKDVGNSLTVVAEHVKQVRLKVRILEVDRSKATQFGINIFQPLGNTSLSGSTTGQFPSAVTGTAATTTQSVTSAGIVTTGTPATIAVSNPLNFLFYDWKYNIGATIQDLETKQVLQILAEPTLSTMSGHEASFLAGGQFPFPVVQPGSGAGSAATVTIQFKPYGVNLVFTPVVNDDGSIRLKVAPEVSALDYTNSVTIGGVTIPALSTRKADTEVELRSDQSFAISGLLDQRTTDAYSRTPGIASIPILGALFKSKNINRSNTELIVIVTPTLVDPLTDNPPSFEPKYPATLLNSDKFDKTLPRLQPSGGFPATQAPPVPPVPAGFPAAKPVTGPAPSASPSSIELPAPQPAPPNFGPATAAVDLPAPVAPHVPSTAAARDIAAAHSVVSTPPPAEHSKPAMVQVMAISHKEDADSIVSALKRKGFDVAVHQYPQDSLLHLQVGPFTSRMDAEAVRQRLVVEGYNATIQ